LQFSSRGFYTLKKTKNKKQILGWGDGSAVKSTVCSSKRSIPEFNSQQPRGDSQPSVKGSDGLFWCVIREQWCTHRHKINKSLKKKKTPQKSSDERTRKLETIASKKEINFIFQELVKYNYSQQLTEVSPSIKPAMSCCTAGWVD
jgi:hypothetical protein